MRVNIETGKTYQVRQFDRIKNQFYIDDATIVNYQKNIGSPDKVTIKLSNGTKTVATNVFKTMVKNANRMNENNKPMFKTLKQHITEKFGVTPGALKLNKQDPEYKSANELFHALKSIDGVKHTQLINRENWGYVIIFDYENEKYLVSIKSDANKTFEVYYYSDDYSMKMVKSKLLDVPGNWKQSLKSVA